MAAARRYGRMPPTTPRTTSWRYGLLTLCATIAALTVAPGIAAASVSVQVSGSTLTVTGSPGADRPYLTYSFPADEDSPGYTRVESQDGVADPLPATCIRDIGGVPPSSLIAYCEDGGSAPSLTTLDLVLGDGDDSPSIIECFEVAHVAAGEGQNSVFVADCDGGTLSWSSGAGHDNVWMQAGGTTTVEATLGAGTDSFMGAGGASVVHGGAGDDDLVGSAANDQLFGDDGDDELAGHEGNDTLDGGAGIDLLATEPGRHYDDDPGADDYRGGPGGDTLFYNDHAAGTTISRNEMADDGTGGEGDNVHDDIETIYGTAFADTFRGGAGDDQVYGGDGNDTLDGAGGSDTLNGDAGNDTIAGGPGSDRLTGDSGDDMINGGAGTDTLNGDRAGCTPPSCIGGNDILFARDGGRDGVSCGPATDSAQLDAGDSIGGDGGAEACESVDRSAPPPAYVVTPAPFKQHFTMTTSGKLTVSKGVGVTVTCPASCVFTASLRISAATARRYGLGRKALTLRRVTASLTSAGSKTIRVTPSSRTRRKLRRARTVPAVLTVQARGVRVKLETKKLAVTLRR